MHGDPGFGTFLMYAGIVLLLLVVVLMFLRLAVMLSLRFLSSMATLLRRLMKGPGEADPD